MQARESLAANAQGVKPLTRIVEDALSSRPDSRRPWEPHKFASIEQQDAKFEVLQAWVADYYTRTGPWSYEAHRRIFDRHTGRKVEYADLEVSAGRE